MSIENLAQYFSTIEDPRCSGKVEHRLIDVLVIAVCAAIACAESWDDIALYGRSKLAVTLHLTARLAGFVAFAAFNLETQTVFSLTFAANLRRSQRSAGLPRARRQR